MNFTEKNLNKISNSHTSENRVISSKNLIRLVGLADVNTSINNIVTPTTSLIA